MGLRALIQMVIVRGTLLGIVEGRAHLATTSESQQCHTCENANSQSTFRCPSGARKRLRKVLGPAFMLNP